MDRLSGAPLADSRHAFCKITPDGPEVTPPLRAGQGRVEFSTSAGTIQVSEFARPGRPTKTDSIETLEQAADCLSCGDVCDYPDAYETGACIDGNCEYWHRRGSKLRRTMHLSRCLRQRLRRVNTGLHQWSVHRLLLGNDLRWDMCRSDVGQCELRILRQCMWRMGCLRGGGVRGLLRLRSLPLLLITTCLAMADIATLHRA
jgi:hypothetical protein